MTEKNPTTVPDTGLDSLLIRLCRYGYDRGVADYVGDAGAVRDHISSAVDTITAIHAHVEARVRAARGEVVAAGTVTGRSWEGGPVPQFAAVSLTFRQDWPATRRSAQPFPSSCGATKRKREPQINPEQPT